MSNPFTDAVVIVTGAASGIGRALAEQCAVEGAVVIMLDKNAAKLEAATAEFAARGLNVEHEVIDMLDAAAVEKVFDRIADSHQTIDYVINNAGTFMGGEIRDTPLSDWHAVMNHNIFAVANGMHSAYQIMLRQKSGHIINLSSTAGLIPIPAMGVYGASKYAITGLTHALRNEAKDFGIRVSVVCPTIVNTPLYDTARYHRVESEKVLRRRESFQTADVATRKIIRGITRNQRTIHTAFSTRLLWWLYRLNPGLYDVVARRTTRLYRQKLRVEK